jgi:hypothetical protein
VRFIEKEKPQRTHGAQRSISLRFFAFSAANPNGLLDLSAVESLPVVEIVQIDGTRIAATVIG